jgi:hypothetical protein
MAATIKIKNSSTASAVPTSSDLVQGELAVNVTDKRLFTENASGTVVELGTNPSILTLPDGSASAPTLTNDGDTNTGIFFPAADTVGITTGGTERARVDSAGNLGLGVTPSAWTTFKALELTGGAIAGIATNQFDVVQNAYYDGSFKYKTTGAATFYQQAGSTHAWYNAASGTAGNAITFTQAMTLDASGRLLIGTTTSGVANNSATAFTVANGSATVFQSVKASGGEELYLYAISGSTGLWAYSNSALTFGTNNTERARIDSSGNLLVGTTTANGKLTVNSGVAAFNASTIFMQNSWSGDVGYAGLYLVKNDNNSTSSQILVRFAINGNAVGQGQINANGANACAFGSFSDARLKENIVDLPSQLDNIMSLRPVEFDYIESEGGGHQIGFIAQEMQEVYPDAVGIRQPDEMLTVTGWSKTEARLVKAIQELKAEFDAYKASHP